MRKSILFLSGVVVTVALLPACTGGSEGGTTTSLASSNGGEDADGAAITIENFAFSGATSVTVGTTITATNQDGVTHTWTSDEGVWDSGRLSSGESFEFTFDEPGEYPYFCTIHPTMEGTITVEG